MNVYNTIHRPLSRYPYPWPTPFYTVRRYRPQNCSINIGVCALFPYSVGKYIFVPIPFLPDARALPAQEARHFVHAMKNGPAEQYRSALGPRAPYY
jgi:hypothetical protein